VCLAANGAPFFFHKTRLLRSGVALQGFCLAFNYAGSFFDDAQGETALSLPGPRSNCFLMMGSALGGDVGEFLLQDGRIRVVGGELLIERRAIIFVLGNVSIDSLESLTVTSKFGSGGGDVLAQDAKLRCRGCEV